MERLEELSARIKKFNEDRDWDQFHTPSNLAKSISIEAGELLECFQWNDTNYNMDNVLEELADVTNYCLQMAQVLGVDIIDDDDTFIKFHDNGDGIPEENKNRIFNPFFSTSTPASYDAPNDEQLVGTGLGLKIVKDIITSYKGSISLVPPNSDYSTCFKITIPQDQ